MKLKIDGFVLFLFITILVAYIFPYGGNGESNALLGIVASIGVSLIFFFYGLRLSIEKIKLGLKNWKLHLLIQTSTFLIFPLVVLAFYPLVATQEQKTIWLAFLFLAALPSTVSSSVMMVSMAKGNIPAAIFNASISGLIGIVITPLWMSLFMQSTNTDFNLIGIYTKLLTEILLPVLLGIALQRFWGKYAHLYSHHLGRFDKFVILLIVYKSFAESFAANSFSAISIGNFGVIIVAVIALFYLMYFLTTYLSRQLGFSLEDSIAAQFCGTKKSIVHGTVFSKVLFQHSVATGIMLLPLMLFHAVQLVFISIIASRMSKR